MKLKHILMSGLCLAAFAACTNDDFTEQQSVSDLKGAIDLGQIRVTIGLDGADTRVLYTQSGTSIKSAWEQDDKVGAAMFGAGTKADNSEGASISSSSKTVFATNNEYFREDSDGAVAEATFTSKSNAMVGKYMFYYPWNADVTGYTESIPVTIETVQHMDVTDPLAHIAADENFFAYQCTPVQGGTSSAAKLELKSLPVLYYLTFAASAENPDCAALVGAKIKQVVIQGSKDTDASGSTNVFYSAGQMKVANSDDWKKITAQYSANNDKSVAAVSVIVADNDDAEYQISKVGAAGKTTKPILLTALPASAAANALKIVVVTDKGTFYRELSKDEYPTMFETIAKENGVFNYTITLDKVDDEAETIWDEDTFMAMWEKSYEGASITPLNLGLPITVDELTIASSRPTKVASR